MAPKILLVDPASCHPALADRLCARGYEVLRAENGLRFVSQLQIENPDVVIMDSRPRFCDSHTLCSAIRSQFRHKPVFFLAREAQEVDHRDHLGCGCTQVFSMPTQLSALIRRIGECAGTP
jgi:DNA-binding response OmpR family regulator